MSKDIYKKIPKGGENQDENKNNPPKEKVEKKVEEEKDVLNDTKFFEKIKEKTGKEVSSYEELFPQNELSFASDAVKSINDFVKDTNRSVDDYFKANQDLTKMSDEEKAISYLMQEENLSKEDAKFLLDDDFRKKEINEEEMDEDEINSAKRHNKRKQIQLNKLVSKADNYLTELRDKYKRPSETYEEKLNKAQGFADKEFNENLSNSIDSLNDLSFGDYYTHKIENKDSLKEQFKSIGSVINSFKDNQGNFDYNEFFRTIYVGRNREMITKDIAKSYRAAGETDIINGMRNKDNNGSNTVNVSDNDGAEKNKRDIENYFLGSTNKIG